MGTSLNQRDTVWAPKGKAVADDGGTYSSVQDAVDAASDTVLVGPGEFEESVTITTPNLTVKGTGTGTLMDGELIGTAVEIDAPDVTVKDIKAQTAAGFDNPYDAVAVTANGADAEVYGVKVSRSDRYGVAVRDGATDVSLGEITVVDTEEDAIHFEQNTPRTRLEGFSARPLVDGHGVYVGGDDSSIAKGTVNGVSGDGVVLAGDKSIAEGVKIIEPRGNGLVATGDDQTLHGSNIILSSTNDNDQIDGSQATRLEVYDCTPQAVNTSFGERGAKDAVGNSVAAGLTYDSQAAEIGLDVVASGSATLASGTTTVDTGIDADATATLLPAIGPATADADIAAEVRANSGGNYVVDFVETADTSVGNPTVEYDIVMVRFSAAKGSPSSEWVDNFNDQDLSDYGGSTNEWDFSTNTVYEGEASLTADTGPVGYIETTGGAFDNNPSPGDRWDAFVRASKVADADDTVRTVLRFGVDGSTGDFFAMSIYWDDLDRVVLQEKVDGSQRNIETTYVEPNFEADVWYRCRFKWDDGSMGGDAGDISVRFYDTRSETRIGEVRGNVNIADGDNGGNFDADIDATDASIFIDSIKLA